MWKMAGAGGSPCKCQLHRARVCSLSGVLAFKRGRLQSGARCGSLVLISTESTTVTRLMSSQVSIPPTPTPTLSLEAASSAQWMMWHDITHSPTSIHISLLRCLWIMGMYISILRAPRACLETLPTKCFIQRWSANTWWGLAECVPSVENMRHWLVVNLLWYRLFLAVTDLKLVAF